MMETNPYARAAGGASASASSRTPLPPEQQRLADYELAIGPNTEYYLPRFESFDGGGSRAGWHWPAFFVTAPWYLYRKMYVPGVLMLLYPWIALIIISIIVAATQPSPVAGTAIGLVIFLAPSILLAIYANSIYHRHITKVITSIPRAIAEQPDKRAARIERNGGTGTGVMIGILVGGFLLATAFIGILAAIAIPAYQDYTIRAQITEGLNLASPLKVEIAEYYAERGAWPEQADITQELPSGQYVSGMEVQGGSIVISYGGKANSNIQNQRLVLSPASRAESRARHAGQHLLDLRQRGREAGRAPGGRSVWQRGCGQVPADGLPDAALKNPYPHMCSSG
jgi:Tfp pilus assembly major pilin PilA